MSSARTEAYKDSREQKAPSSTKEIPIATHHPQQTNGSPARSIERLWTQKQNRTSSSLSPKARIDGILEGARARKVAMGSSSHHNHGSNSNLSDVGPLDLNSSTSRTAGSGNETESADEHTSILNRDKIGGVGYQSTTITSTNNGGGGMSHWPATGLSTVDDEGHTHLNGRDNRPSSRGSGVRRKGVKNRASTQSIRRAGRVLEASEQQEDDVDGVGGDEHESWWARWISEYGSIELENKGSVARDHLALERTFLAWLRTSLAFASIGIAITQLFRLNTTSSSPAAGGADPYAQLRQMGKPLGATFLGISIVMLFVGFNRYFQSQHWIIRGKFPASRGSIAFVAAVTFALMVTSLVIVITVEPGVFEKK